MATVVYPLINTFNTGEISPLPELRNDLNKYSGACRILENFIIYPQGAAIRRPGTYFVASTKYANKKARLISFDFSTEQSYIIEVGDRYMRFYKDFGIIMSGGVPYEIETPYLEEHLFQLKTVQSADTMYIAHRMYPPKVLTRTGHTAWTLTDFVARNGASTAISAATKANPCVITSTNHKLNTGDSVYITGVLGMVELNNKFYKVTKINDNTVSLDGVNSTNYGTYTSGGTLQKCVFGTDGNMPNAVSFFEERLMMGGTRNRPQTVWGSYSGNYDNFLIDGAIASSGIEMTISSDKVDSIRWLVGQDYLVIGTVGSVWRMGASSKDSPLSMDNVVVKRQVAIGCKDIDAEMVGDVIMFVQRSGYNLRTYKYSLDVDKWVAPDLTVLAEHITKGNSVSNSGIVEVAFQQEPIMIVWCVRKDGQLLAMTYEPDQNVWGWSRIVTDGRVESVGVVGEDDAENQVWIIVAREVNGQTVRYVEYFKPHEFWNKIEDCFFVDSGLTYFGGNPVAISNITKASPAVVTATGHQFANGDLIRIYGVKGMTEVNIDQTTCYTVTSSVAGVSFALQGVNSSSWGTYVSGGFAVKVSNTFSGLTHLIGKAVDILADGAAIPRQTVSQSGTLSLPIYANKVHAGLPYVSTLKPMRIEINASDGSTHGRRKRISNVTVSFFKTCCAKWGNRLDSLEEVPFSAGGNPVLYTGDKDYYFSGEYATETDIIIVQDRPFPCTVRSIISKLGVYE